MTGKEMAAQVIAAMKDAVGAVKTALTQRIETLEQKLATIPAGEKGEPGERGPAGERGEKGEPGEMGLDGRDGKDGLPGQRGLNGRDGTNGRDGLGFEDLSVAYDGEREFVLRFERGDRVKEFRFELPLVIDRGFWRDGLAVAKGDGVTFGGSYWIAQTSTSTKPDTGNAEWRLAVKKGRDGKAGDRGAPGPQGEKGLPGLNGKNLS